MDFESVSLSSLKKYRRQFQIRVKPTAPKAELAAAIAEHFASIPVPGEEEAISKFLQAVQASKQARSAAEADSSAETDETIPQVERPVVSPAKSRSRKQQSDRTQSSSAIRNASQSNSSALKKSRRESKLSGALCWELGAFIYFIVSALGRGSFVNITCFCIHLPFFPFICVISVPNL